MALTAGAWSSSMWRTGQQASGDVVVLRRRQAPPVSQGLDENHCQDTCGELLSPCRCDGSVRCTHQPCLIRWISERGSWSCELCYFKYQVLAISTKNPLQIYNVTFDPWIFDQYLIQAASTFGAFRHRFIRWRFTVGIKRTGPRAKHYLIVVVVSVRLIPVHLHHPQAEAGEVLHWQAISLTVIEKVQIAAIILGSLFLIASISWLIWSSLSPSAKWQRQDLLFQICYGMYGFMDIVCIGLIIHEGSSVYRIFKRWQAVNQQWKVLNYEKSKDLGDPLSSSKSANRGSRGNPHGLASSSGGRQSRRLRTILNHHCGYTILHILSQLRPHDPRISAAASREVVMRVTTV
ncbi:unnamed protein product [Pleuronectes platessa]|uniref:RING-type E3 ubiquitin transferase n=1 Tax=Pleuronectes platessa TaxID=8262 RepID=A0A9N7ZA92_PLEPL|nr:unnamed protein product [Pleuronectes platessa]